MFQENTSFLSFSFAKQYSLVNAKNILPFVLQFLTKSVLNTENMALWNISNSRFRLDPTYGYNDCSTLLLNIGGYTI